MRLLRSPKNYLYKRINAHKIVSLYEESLSTYSNLIQGLIDSNEILITSLKAYIDTHEAYDSCWDLSDQESLSNYGIMLELAYINLKEAYTNATT